MDDLISRRKALNTVEDAYRFSDGDIEAYHDAMVASLTELIAERKTGRWIRTRMPLTGAIEHRCSRCDTPYYMAFAMEMNYCPSCGAKMEVEHED